AIRAGARVSARYLWERRCQPHRANLERGNDAGLPGVSAGCAGSGPRHRNGIGKRAAHARYARQGWHPRGGAGHCGYHCAALIRLAAFFSDCLKPDHTMAPIIKAPPNSALVEGYWANRTAAKKMA